MLTARIILRRAIPLKKIGKKLRIIILLCIIITAFCTSPVLRQNVYAANDIADTVQTLQDKVSAAMYSRLTTYTVDYTGNLSTIQADISKVINNIYDADDYMHYTTKSYSYSCTQSGSIATLKFSFSYWITAAQADFVTATVNDVLAQIITADMNDFQKEKAIHDWIVTRVAYDTSLVQHSDYAALVSPYKTVCQGYALLGYKMLNQVGIQTRILEGTAGNQAHAWNEVLLDGIWYHLDPTWDDPVPDVQGRVTYNYYNLTDDQIMVNHKWTKSYPSADKPFSDTLNERISSDTANEAFYEDLYNKIGLQYLLADNTVNNSSELSTRLQQAIQNQQTEIVVRYINKSTLAADLKTAITNMGNILSYSYSASDYLRTTDLGDVILDLNFTSTVPINVTGISLNQSNVSLTLGGSAVTLIPTISPANASNKNIIWTSSNPAAATVTAGVVKAVGGGTATITATTVDGSKTASAVVNVTAPVTSVTLDKSTLMLKVGAEDVTLIPTINPVSATNKNISWSSSNPSVATVDATGKVYAVASGTAVISAITQDGAKVAKCTVTVPVTVTGISLNTVNMTLKYGTTATLTPVFTPSNATVKTVTWESSDTSVVTVTAGKLTPVADGTATVTVTSTDGGYKATCTVTVIHAVTGVALDKTSLTLKLGDADVTLIPTIAPANATIKDIVWSSSNPKAVTVDSDGKVHAVAVGTATISAASKQDSTKVAKCTVTVPVVVTGISLNTANLTLKYGTTVTLTPVFTPSNATVKAVAWESSDTSVVTVTAGKLTPVADGTATVTVTSTDGGYKATCTVTVIHTVTGVTLDKTSLTLKLGDADVKLIASVAPTNATIKDIVWSSSNPKAVTVDSTGTIHAVAAGTATISAASKQDSTKVAKCTVIVPVVVTGISLNTANLTLKYGTTATLTPVFTPSNATVKTVTWESSDTSVVTVTAGKLTPVADGTATVTVTSTDGGYKATCTVTVIHAVTGVTLDKTSLTLKLGDADVTLNAVVAPTNATIKDIVWSSSNPKAVTVDSTGTIHAVAAGTAIISAASKQDSTKVAKCTVTVPVVVTGISLNTANLTLKYGTTATLTPVFTPSNATVKTVAWDSSDTSVVTVTAGKLTPVADGTATVTVTSTDGGYKATCTVTVIHAVTGVTLDKTSLTLKLGDADVKLIASVAPTNATIKDIVWSSSNPKAVTVDSTGTIHAVAAGTATISAASKQDSTKVAKCTVYVTAP